MIPMDFDTVISSHQASNIYISGERRVNVERNEAFGGTIGKVKSLFTRIKGHFFPTHVPGNQASGIDYVRSHTLSIRQANSVSIQNQMDAINKSALGTILATDKRGHDMDYGIGGKNKPHLLKSRSGRDNRRKANKNRSRPETGYDGDTETQPSPLLQRKKISHLKTRGERNEQYFRAKYGVIS